MAASPEHWSRYAPHWSLVGPPLRPSPADIAVFAARLRMGTPPRRALLLGVTPELLEMERPAAMQLLAVDHAPEMIRRHRQERTAMLCADWRALPLTDNAVDATLGDGALNVMAGAGPLAAFVAEQHRVLRPSGLLLLRIFTRPDQAEPLGPLFGALAAGQIGGFHAFKWRLAMALHGLAGEGVRLADIWECWRAYVPEPAALLRRLGWDEALLRTIDVYRGAATRYTFPTIVETSSLFAHLFIEKSRHINDYELGERCPVVAFTRL